MALNLENQIYNQHFVDKFLRLKTLYQSQLVECCKYNGTMVSTMDGSMKIKKVFGEIYKNFKIVFELATIIEQNQKLYRKLWLQQDRYHKVKDKLTQIRNEIGLEVLKYSNHIPGNEISYDRFIKMLSIDNPDIYQDTRYIYCCVVEPQLNFIRANQQRFHITIISHQSEMQKMQEMHNVSSSKRVNIILTLKIN